jgi:uncharacterized protein (DUF2249 family)
MIPTESALPQEILVDARDLEPPEPFERAMAAVELLRPGQRVRLLLHREPFPLYNLLDSMGMRHETSFTVADGYFTILIDRDR